MNKKVKKFIAREGLVIIGLVVGGAILGGILGYTVGWIEHNKKVKAKLLPGALTDEQTTRLSNPPDTVEKKPIRLSDIPDGPIKEKNIFADIVSQKETSSFIPDKPVDLSFRPDRNKKTTFTQKPRLVLDEPNWRLFNVDVFWGVWVLVCACYSIYWLVRFIGWSVRTLREE